MGIANNIHELLIHGRQLICYGRSNVVCHQQERFLRSLAPVFQLSNDCAQSVRGDLLFDFNGIPNLMPTLSNLEPGINALVSLGTARMLYLDREPPCAEVVCGCSKQIGFCFVHAFGVFTNCEHARIMNTGLALFKNQICSFIVNAFKL